MPLARINTRRTRLRAFTPADIDGVTELMTDADVMRFTGFREPQPEERIQEFLAKWCAAEDAPWGVWCVEELGSGAFVGWSMLRPTTETDPELGFMFLASQWGRGFATEVSAALLDHAFRALGSGRVIACVAPEHDASIRVLKKVGMREIAVRDGVPSLLQFEIVAT